MGLWSEPKKNFRRVLGPQVEAEEYGDREKVVLPRPNPSYFMQNSPGDGVSN